MQYETIKTLKKQTEHALKTYPHVRNDDRALVKIVCETFGHDPIAKATSIERCRRWFNQRGRFLPTDERVARQRKMNLDEWRVAMGYRTASGNFTPPSVQNQPKEYLIPSETKRGVFYKVLDFGSGFKCECQSFAYRHSCKHVKRAVERAQTERQIPLFAGVN